MCPWLDIVDDGELNGFVTAFATDEETFRSWWHGKVV
jgi:hypothetical protein